MRRDVLQTDFESERIFEASYSCRWLKYLSSTLVVAVNASMQFHSTSVSASS